MKLRQDKVKELMFIYCANNYNRFARELEVDPGHLHRYMTKERCGGKKIISAVIKYCREKGLNYEEYIEL